MAEQKQENKPRMPPRQEQRVVDPNFKHIVRIANVDVPGGKPIKIAMTNIKGIGQTFAVVVCVLAGVDRSAKAGNLKDSEVEKINSILNSPAKAGIPKWMFNRRKDYQSGEDKHLLTGDLNFVQENDLKRLKKIKTLRGARHIRGQPVRGQRTRSNFRRNKGKVVGVQKKTPQAAKAGADDKKKK